MTALVATGLVPNKPGVPWPVVNGPIVNVPVGPDISMTELTELIEVACREGLGAAVQAARLAADFQWPAGDVQPGSEALALARSEGIELTRPAANATRPSGSRPSASWRLVAIRIGVAERLLALAIKHLGQRQVDGEPLARRQLIRGAIAEITTALGLCRAALQVAPDTGAVNDNAGGDAAEWVHDRLDLADAELVGLFGASGYLRDHPVRCLHVIALLRNLCGETHLAGADRSC